MAAEQRLFEVTRSKLSPDVHLIEASAGTGKTYTIAMLVLRFVAELGIDIEEILLVTFTRAATAELAERIRGRLAEGRDLLEGKEGDFDETLLRWAKGLADRQLALVNLRKALIDIDRAPIFTIHGFCQRMLQDQALESGQLFDVELEPEQAKLQQLVLADFWRLHIYSLPRLQGDVVLAHYPSPAKLYASVGHLSQNFVAIEPQVEEIEQTSEKFENRYREMAAWWQQNGATLQASLENLIEAGKLKKHFSDNFEQWWAALSRYFENQENSLPKGLTLLQRQEFEQQINGTKVRGDRKNELLDHLPLPGQFLNDLLGAVNDLLLSIRGKLVRYFLAETERRMIESNIMAYDDLIVRLYRAVTAPEADGLVSLLRKRFRAAVIDEFQDTDNLQWQIFQTVFSGGNHYLYLIGDPKQAIYKFRGADIHSYFQAKLVADHILTLDKNYRSHPGIVEGVNSLFSLRSRPFLFAEAQLDFIPATSAVPAEETRLQQNEVPLANMVFCQLEEAAAKNDGTWSSGEAASAIMHQFVSQIIDLLENKTRLEQKEESRLLRPSDIAILVRQHRQAEEYRNLLEQVGIPAVTASKISVFESRECTELYQLLNALANPGNIGLLKRAMTISWLGLSGTELHQVWQNDHIFDQYYTRFQEYVLSWRQQGLLLMFNHFLENEGVLTTLGGAEQSERRITNIYHLVELLQQAEEDNMFGPLQLLQWLRRNMKQPTGENEQRLESDEQAVRIITMHASKGLEYPIVFCPSLWYRSSRLEGEQERIVCREESGLVLDLGSEHFEGRSEETLVEEMAEELRLCYVAVTRAKLRCYIAWCDHKGRKGGPADSFYSGLGYLLFPQGRVSFDEQQQVLEEMGRKSYATYQQISTATKLKIASFREIDNKDSLKRRIRQRGPLYASHQMTSYSALVSGGGHDGRDEDFLEVDTQVSFTIPEDRTLAIPFATLPFGPNFGNIVHDILESIPFSALQEPDTRQEEITAICQKYGIEVDLPLLLEMLRTVVTSPLNSTVKKSEKEFTLAQLNESRCVKEMGFYFHLAKGNTTDINRLLADVKTVGLVNEKDITGYLTGFIDLVFAHNEKFYIIDYKTNYLGETADSYSQVNLVKAMAGHNYGLQYYLYTLVIHRYLKNVMPDYDYDVHFGGIYYLFVRGMDGGPKGVFYDKPEQAKLVELARCFEDT
ncbi:MAG: exodeoxyribonuclease V subunit beta [Desulfocapsaceae bacterium]|nr:exodeoxyribonuclease V subunit beta [Desulfocapsaceae bacterium]